MDAPEQKLAIRHWLALVWEAVKPGGQREGWLRKEGQVLLALGLLESMHAFEAAGTGMLAKVQMLLTGAGGAGGEGGGAL